MVEGSPSCGISVALLVVVPLLFSSAVTAENVCQKRMAIFTFNASLPMMQFTIDGTNFHTQLLQMNSKELEESRVEALEYFGERFGINAEDHARDVAIRNYETNPLVNMRCIYLSGGGAADDYYMPPEGLIVRDGGWMLTIINPNGITLSGQYAGTLVPFGTTFSVGHWVLQLVGENRSGYDRLIWSNRHVAPGGVATYNEGSRSFHGIMEVNSDEWGAGESLHVAKYTVDQRGRATAQLRNFITFHDC